MSICIGRPWRRWRPSPGLLAADSATQNAILRAFAHTYPDALTFVLYDADGRPIARGDDVADPDPLGYPLAAL